MSTAAPPTAADTTALTNAHIQAGARLQQITAASVATAWTQLRSYDDADVDRFLALVVPVVLAAQRQSVALTTAYLGRAIGRRVVADADRLIGAAIRTATPDVIAASQRGGLALAPDATTVPPQIVYRRPFIGVWHDLAQHTPWQDAVDAGRERATATAAMDVQNTMRHTLRAVGETEDLILGYRRVPDSDACPFCKLIAGRRYLTSDLMEVHPRCCCGVDVITAANRGDFTGKPENDLAVTRAGVTAAVAIHGELGPLLVNGAQHFTGPDQIAA